MTWNDIPRWEKMTSQDLAEEAEFPSDCDAIYVNNCYELSYVPCGELAEMDAESYVRWWRGSVFKMLFQVHYEFLNGRDDVPIRRDTTFRRCRRLRDWEPGDVVLFDDPEWTIKYGW